ncbi:MAG: hypothetical protein HUJ76_08655 [Parasporobacterium sp.]|nr:hypothetical protein [Parasporobacterium sp.]
MSIYLIDFENVHDSGLNGILQLTEQDEVSIFYSQKSEHMSFDTHANLMKAKAEVQYIKMRKCAKNYLDFQLSTHLGYLIGSNAKGPFFVISKDTGYDSIIDYWRDRNEIVVRMPSIAYGFDRRFKDTINRLLEGKPADGSSYNNNGGTVSDADVQDAVPDSVSDASASIAADISVIEAVAVSESEYSEEPAAEALLFDAEPFGSLPYENVPELNGNDFPAYEQEEDGPFMNVPETSASAPEQDAEEDADHNDVFDAFPDAVPTAEDIFSEDPSHNRKSGRKNRKKTTSRSAKAENNRNKSEQTADTEEKTADTEVKTPEVKAKAGKTRVKSAESKAKSADTKGKSAEAEVKPAEAKEMPEVIHAASETVSQQTQLSGTAQTAPVQSSEPSDSDDTRSDALPEAFRKKVRLALRGKKIPSGNYAAIYKAIVNCYDKLALNNHMVKSFGSSKGGIVYNAIKDVFMEYQNL